MKEKLKKIGERTWAIDPVVNWSPAGVHAYNKLQSKAEYRRNITEKEKRFINDILPYLTKLIVGKFSIIDLGPGDGEKSAIVYKYLLNEQKIISYTGLDISSVMISKARKRFSSEKLGGNFVETDFVSGVAKICNLKPKLFLMLGLTIFDEKERYIDLLLENMRRNDLAFFTFKTLERTNVKEDMASYGSNSAMNFHKSTLDVLGLKLGREISNIEVTDEVGVYARITTLNELLRKAGVRIGDRIRIGLSLRPKLLDIANRIEEKGFEANVLDNGDNILGILIRKKRRTTNITLTPPKLNNKHPYKRHFSGTKGMRAFSRMYNASRELSYYLKVFLNGKEKILEIGPFYDPLVTKKSFPFSIITYLDRDEDALEFLKSNGSNIIHYDLDSPRLEGLPNLPKQDAVVSSHIVNHIGLPTFISIIRKTLKKGGYAFINESIDYGGDIMHPKRPKTIQEILEGFGKNGFNIVCYRLIPTNNPRYQPNTRIIAVFEKKSEK